MDDQDPAVATQLANMERRTGKTRAELAGIVRASGLTKHGELIAMLKHTLGMGHGDANLLVRTVHRADAGAPAPATPQEALDQLYQGPKAALRPIHDALLDAMRAFGAFEAAPKKAYVSYRRRRQFCTIGPATRSLVDLGMNVVGLPDAERLEALPAGHMCAYRVRFADASEVDAEVVGWLRAAFDAAG